MGLPRKRNEQIIKKEEAPTPKYIGKKKFKLSITDPIGKMLAEAKPLKGTPLRGFQNLPKEERQSIANKLNGISFYKGPVSREQFIYAYCRALTQRNDIMPIPFMTPVYLTACKKYKPAKSFDGFFGFTDGNILDYFVLPSFRYVDGYPEFNMKDSYYTVPLSLNPKEGIRIDALYVYQRDVSLYYIPKQVKILNTMNRFMDELRAFPLGYNDHSRDEDLKEYMSIVRRLKRYLPVTDIDMLEDMLFNPYGQHRFVLEHKEDHKILAVIIWSEFDGFVYMYHTVGWLYRTKDAPKYNNKATYKEYIEYSAKYKIRYPGVILRYEFMKRFPKGTYFIADMPAFSRPASWQNVVTQPVHVFELRTRKDVITGYDSNGALNTVRAMLPYEYNLGRNNPKWGMLEVNKVLFNTQAKKIAKMNFTEEQWDRYNRKIKLLRKHYADLKTIYNEIMEKRLKKDLTNG